MILVHVQWPHIMAIDFDKGEYLPMRRPETVDQVAYDIAKLTDAVISIDIAVSPGLTLMHRLQTLDIPAERFITWPKRDG